MSPTTYPMPQTVKTAAGDVYVVACVFSPARVLVNFGGAFVLMRPDYDGAKTWDLDPEPANAIENATIAKLTSAYTDKTQVTVSTRPDPFAPIPPPPPSTDPELPEPVDAADSNDEEG